MLLIKLSKYIYFLLLNLPIMERETLVDLSIFPCTSLNQCLIYMVWDFLLGVYIYIFRIPVFLVSWHFFYHYVEVNIFIRGPVFLKLTWIRITSQSFSQGALGRKPGLRRWASLAAGPARPFLAVWPGDGPQPESVPPPGRQEQSHLPGRDVSHGRACRASARLMSSLFLSSFWGRGLDVRDVCKCCRCVTVIVTY